MNKSGLIEVLASRANISLNAADKVVNEIFDTMADTLIAGNRIEIRGFGSFVVKDYEGYVGRNPRTGIETTVAPKKLPFFKVGKELKERVMGI